MFGMLDYRAHKLYWLLFFIPNTMLYLIVIFGLPFISYLIGFQLAETRFFQILISLISLSVIGLIWLLFILFVVNKFFQFVFSLFVDIIPHDGRTKEEAQLVVWEGEKAIVSLALAKEPETWTDEMIHKLPKNDWVTNIFYRNRVIRRLELIRNEATNPARYDPLSLDEADQLLKDHSIDVNLFEQIVTTRKTSIVEFLIFLLLLLTNPLAS